MLNVRLSQFVTGGTILIDEHYREIGLDKGWKNDRVNRLCNWLQITPQELGKLCCIEFVMMNRFINDDHFPPHVALHFALIEAWYLETVKGLPQEPIMPIDKLYGAH